MTGLTQVPRLWFQNWAAGVLARSTTFYSPLWAGRPRELLKPDTDSRTGLRGGARYLGRFSRKERGGHTLWSSRVSERKRSGEEKAILVLDQRGWLATALLMKPTLAGNRKEANVY